MMRAALVRCAVMLTVALPAVIGAQTWRTLDASRPARDTSALAVHVMYGAGRVRVLPAPDRNLYDVHLRYDAERTDPLYRFDAAARTLDVGIRHTSIGHNVRDGDASELQLQLARTMPIRLELDVGAAEGDYDLSGLQLDALSLRTGASDSRMRFDTPNVRRLRTMRLDVGAASLKVAGLANANAERIEVNLGVGQVVLEFGGEWRGDVDMTVASALGSVTMRVPNDVGIRVESSTFLHSLDAPDLVKRDGFLASSNWDSARYKLRIRSTGALGELKIQRTAR